MPDTKNTIRLSLDDIEAKSIVWNLNDKYTYAYGLSHEERSEIDATNIMDVLTSDGWRDTEWYCFFVEDCAPPPLYAVLSSTWESAYKTFIDYAADRLGIAISDEDMPDYLDADGDYSGSYSSDGTAVDTERVNGFSTPLKLERIDVAD